MAWKTNMSGTTELADRLVQVYYQQFIVSAADTLTKGLPSLATFKEGISGKAEEFTIYAKLTKQTSALTEDIEKTPEAMSDSKVTITPVEYGNAISQTKLVQLQSGGMTQLAAFKLTGINMRESVEYKMILMGEAGSNELIVTQAAEGSLTASDIMTSAQVQKAYNKLDRAGIPQPYWAYAHPDVLYDLRTETNDGGWIDVKQYQNPDEIVNNELGMFGGFRWINGPLATINANAGNSNVDTYHTQFFGENAFGYCESETPDLVIVPPSDNLARFYNIGWYGVYEFGLVDTNAHWMVTSASTVGANT